MHVCRYCPSTSGATSVNGTEGCSLYFLGRLYDGLSSKRRGVSSLSLPKPKLHLKLNEAVSVLDTQVVLHVLLIMRDALYTVWNRNS